MEYIIIFFGIITFITMIFGAINALVWKNENADSIYDSAWLLEHSNDCCPNAVSFKHFFWKWNEHNCYCLFRFHYSN